MLSAVKDIRLKHGCKPLICLLSADGSVYAVCVDVSSMAPNVKTPMASGCSGPKKIN